MTKSIELTEIIDDHKAKIRLICDLVPETEPERAAEIVAQAFNSADYVFHYNTEKRKELKERMVIAVKDQCEFYKSQRTGKKYKEGHTKLGYFLMRLDEMNPSARDYIDLALDER